MHAILGLLMLLAGLAMIGWGVRAWLRRIRED